jgi:hypothetical protein
VTAVALTVLIAFLVMIGFAAIVVQEISSLALQLPEYRANLEAKIRSLPAAVPGGGALRRATSMVQELGRELKQSASNDGSGLLSVARAGRSCARSTRFARDSSLEEAGFELVWGFSCQAVVFGFCCQFFVRRCVQVRLACSAGDSPAGVKVRAP